MKKEDLNIMANMKLIEELKANLLCVIGEFYFLLTKGANVTKESILNCIGSAIVILYVLAQRLGYSCEDVDDSINKSLRIGIAEEHEYEKDGKCLTKLKHHLNRNH